MIEKRSSDRWNNMLLKLGQSSQRETVFGVGELIEPKICPAGERMVPISDFHFSFELKRRSKSSKIKLAAIKITFNELMNRKMQIILRGKQT